LRLEYKSFSAKRWDKGVTNYELYIADFQDTYKNLTYKTLAMLYWVHYRLSTGKFHPKWIMKCDDDNEVDIFQVSITQTFYEQLLRKKVFGLAFLSLQFVSAFVIFWQKEIGKKAVCKILVKSAKVRGLSSLHWALRRWDSLLRPRRCRSVENSTSGQVVSRNSPI